MRIVSEIKNKMPKSTYLGNAFLNAILRNTALTSPATPYLALYNGDPTSGGVEVTGGDYIRQSVTFSSPVSGSTSNTNLITYTNMPSVTVSHVALCSASTAGNILYYSPVATPKTITSGDAASIAIGGINVTEN